MWSGPAGCGNTRAGPLLLDPIQRELSLPELPANNQLIGTRGTRRTECRRAALMEKIRSSKLPHLEFLAELRQLVKRYDYTIAPIFERIEVYDATGRTVASFRRMAKEGPVGPE